MMDSEWLRVSVKTSLEGILKPLVAQVLLLRSNAICSVIHNLLE